MIRSAVLVVLLFLAAWALLSHARARDLDGRYADASPAVRDWYRNAQLTPAAQKRFTFKSCCDHADVVKTMFMVDRSSGDDVWLYRLPNGSWKAVPVDIIHWGESAPDGQPTLFKINNDETCFYPGEGGN